MKGCSWLEPQAQSLRAPRTCGETAVWEWPNGDRRCERHAPKHPELHGWVRVAQVVRS